MLKRILKTIFTKRHNKSPNPLHDMAEIWDECVALQKKNTWSNQQFDEELDHRYEEKLADARAWWLKRTH